MYNYTPDEVMQVEIDDLRTELNKIKDTKYKTEFKDIHDMNFTVGKCYEFRFSENRNAIFLERRGDVLYFVTTGSGRIGALKDKTSFYEEGIVNNASILVVDLNLIFDDCVYARELI